MQCPDCGAYYSEGDEFCGECGRRLSSEAAGSDAEPKAPPTGTNGLELTGDLFEPPPPAAVPAKTRPKKANLLPIMIAGALAALLLCLCAIGAIVWLVVSEESAATPRAPVVPATAAPLAPTVSRTGALLYEENFDDPASGWDVFDEADTIVGYEDGRYQIAINQANYMAWGNPEPALDLADLSIEVDVRQVDGPLDNNFGIFVRYVDDDDGEQSSYYWFQISADGFYSVDLRKEGEWISLVSWEPSSAIYTGLGATNRLRVECSGGWFSFYTNDVHLVELSDSTVGRGSIGLAAGAFEEPGVVVQFDDIRVYKLGQ